MGLRFGLLGPVQVHSDGTDVTPATLKQRTLLTALLLHPNRAVPLAGLASALWDEEPPRSATANLRTYVNRLRRLIPDPGCTASARRIMARHPGYLLSVCPDELDVDAFTERHRRGREALLRGDAESAAATLTEALLLWRGSAAEDVPRTPELAPLLESLDERRSAVLEDLMESRLMLAPDAGLVAELRRHAAEERVRERLWAQLMLAQYRTGDPAGALHSYQAARRALREHLGVEPGERLTLLQERILNRDPALDRRFEGRAPSAAHARAPLPVLPAPGTVYGREPERDALRRMLKPAAHLVVAAVHGPIGAGKSTLAAAVAQDVAESFPDGVVYLDLGGGLPHRTSRASGEVLSELILALGGTETQSRVALPERAMLVQRLARGRRLLLVVDNAESEAQVRPLLGLDSGSAVLVTGRRRCTALRRIDYVELRPLPESAALDLLAAGCGRQRVLAEPRPARRICELCDRNPYALWLAGQRLEERQEWPLAAFASLLEDERRRLEVLRCGDLSMGAALQAELTHLEHSAEQWDRAAALLLRRLGSRDDGPIVPSAAQSLLGCDSGTAVAVLGRLADRHMIEPVGENRYLMPGLWRALAVQAHRPDEPCWVTPGPNCQDAPPQAPEADAAGHPAPGPRVQGPRCGSPR